MNKTLPDVSALAARFSHYVREELNPEIVEEVIRRNAAEPDVTICHSHDFTDANQLMATAWEDLTGRRIDGDNEAECKTWGAAWREARAKGFAP